MKTLGEHTFELGIDLMRLYQAHDRVAETRRTLDSYRPSPVLIPIKRITNGDDGAASNLSG